MDTVEDDDLTLLERYVSARDEAAFRVLVERHSPMVRGAALRCLADEHLADDVVQAVFICLARKAPALRGHLAGWLHNAAVLEARNVRRKADRHSRKMTRLRMEPTDPPSAPAGDAHGSDVFPHLDECIAALAARPRQMLIMRFFERRSLREIADAVGKTEEACRKEIGRCLQKLADRLRHRGVRITASSLFALLTAEALSAPVSHAAVIASVATASVPAGTAAALPSAFYLMTASHTLKIAVVAVALSAIPTVWLWRRNVALEEHVRTLEAPRAPRTLPPSSAVLSLPPEKKSVPSPVPSESAPPAATAPPDDKAAADRAKAAAFIEGILGHVRKAVRPEAEKEMARLALLLPDLSPDQRERAIAALEQHGNAKIDALTAALKTDILSRILSDPHNISEADQATIKNFQNMEKFDPLQQVLTPQQFAEHTAAREKRRLGDAEGKASEAIRKLGDNFTLTEAQKDAIFQGVAANELKWSGPNDEQVIGPVRDIARDDERARLIRAQLTPEQAEFYDRKTAEDKARALQFLQLLGGKADKGAKSP